jgi:hypothetical protein
MSYEEEDACMSYEEEDACMSYEEDACMSYEEEDACMSYEEEDACLSYTWPILQCSLYICVLYLGPGLSRERDELDEHNPQRPHVGHGAVCL